MNGPEIGIETLRGAIDELAERLPAGSPGRKRGGALRASVALVVLASVAVGAYWLTSRRVKAPTAGTPRGVEVKLLRVRGRDVPARVFDAARAGTLVIAPVTGRGAEAGAAARPLGAVVTPRGGRR